MLLVAFMLIVTTIYGTASSTTYEPIAVKSYAKLTHGIEFQDLENAFDNDPTTQSLFHSAGGQVVSIMLELPGEYQIRSAEIISDVPSNLKQTVHVGYTQDGETHSGRLTYECIPQRTSTMCRPSCNEDNSREGVVGNSILWTFQRTKESGWTRIYDVIVIGRLFQQPISSEAKAADITFLKPYFNRALGANYDREQCAEPVWKLTDSSKAYSKMSPVSNFHRNVTLYFGQAYSITKVALIASEQDSGAEECVIRFGGRKSVTKRFSLKSDCTIQNKTVGLHVCSTPDLMGYPFTNATIDAKGLVRVHIFGMLWFYPSVRIIPILKAIDPETSENLKMQCVASTCEEEHSISKCDRYGHIVQCAYLELARTHEVSDDDHVRLPDTVLVTNGRVKPEVAEVITELNILESSSTKLITTMPRTHSFYGQYKCRCQTDDPFTSIVESTETKLPPTEFDQDLVFDRTFTAKLDGDEIPNTLGFLELPETTGYFSLTISGHSLTDKVKLLVTYLESGKLASLTEEYAQITSVQAFPRAKGTPYAWPIQAYRIVQDNAWPDATDEGLTTVEWKTKDGTVPSRKVADQLRTVVLSPRNAGTVRAWVWRRDAHMLDIRAYYQVDVTNEKEKKLYLQRTGCSVADQPEQISSVTLIGNECKKVVRKGAVECERTKGGFAVQFTVTNPSTSDSYFLYEVMEDQESDKQLADSASVVKGLKAELDAADIRMKLIGLKNELDTSETQMDVIITIHSKMIVDNSACRPTFVKLKPSWPVTEQLEQRVGQNQTKFSLSVPNDQQLLNVDVEVRIEGGEDSGNEAITTRTLHFVNPRHLKPELKLDAQEDSVTWTALDEQISEVLEKFEVKMWSTNKVCGIREEETPPRVERLIENLMVYQLRLSDLPNFKSPVLVDHEIEVTPIFKSVSGETIRGVTASVVISKGKIGKSRVEWDKFAANRTARVYVTPSQPASCIQGNPAMNVKFDLQFMGQDSEKRTHLDELQFDADEAGRDSGFGKWYTIQNLQPGRRYEVKATVLYPTGLQDEQSPSEDFWTTDEVFVSTSEVFASPGERVVIQCTGTVGPDGLFKKRLEWKRADGSQLPDGTRVETSTEKTPEGTETLNLIFEQVEAGQANDYACFIRPSVASQVGAEYIAPTVKLIVNVLNLDIESHVANVADPITVQCRSHQGSTITWTSPNGMEVGKDRQLVEPYVTDVTNDQGTISVLHIPSVKLAHTGQYLCKQDGTENYRTFKLKMREDVRLSVDEGSSQSAGENLSITCNALLGHMEQKVEWFMRAEDNEPWTPVSNLAVIDPSLKIVDKSADRSNGHNTHTSTLRVINSPASDGEYACALKTMSGDNKQFTRETMELPKTSATIRVTSEPVVKLDHVNRLSEKEVTLKCKGYPAHEEDRLQWYYISPDGSQEIPISEAGTNRDVKDPELVQQLESILRISDSTPASWPGLTSPVLLAASRKLVARNAETSTFTPEVLELTMLNATETGLDNRLFNASLVCRYRRPRAIMEMKEGRLTTQPDENTSTHIQKVIRIDQLISSTANSDEKILLGSAGIAVVDLTKDKDSGGLRLGPTQTAWVPLWTAFALFLIQEL